MNKLFAGPWIGEFGWELFCWQGYIRNISKKYDNIIIGCRKKSVYLYSDFADDYIFIDPESTDTTDFRCKGYKDFGDYKILGYTDIISPENIPFILVKGGIPILTVPQDFIVFGEENDTDIIYDIVLHARSTNKYGSEERNWSCDKWEELVYLLKKNNLKIASMGTKKDAMYIPGTIDIRSYSCKDLCYILRNSLLAIGPSSGPMHLASLCMTPHLVWSGHRRNKARYENLWNPHKTPVYYIGDDGWQPKVDTIYNKIMNILIYR